MAATGFTFIGSLDAGSHGRLSPKGQFQPANRSWSLDWWIGTGERWFRPSEAASVRQSRPGAGPVIDTRMRIGTADVVCRVFGAAAPLGSDVVMEFTNEAKAPVALAISLQPHDLEARHRPGSTVVINDEVILIDGEEAVLFDRPPNAASDVDGLDLTTDQAQRVAVFPLLHSATVRLVIPAAAGEPVRTLPESDAVVRGWNSIVERNGSFSFGDNTVSELAAACRARVLLEVPTLPERIAEFQPGSGRILEALATSAGVNDVVKSLQAFASGFCLGLPGSPGDASAVLAGIGRSAQLLNDEAACGELVEPAAQLAHLIERSGDGVAAREALVGLRRVLSSAGHHEPAAELAQRTATWDGRRADIPSGLDALASFGQQAGESGAFGPDDAADASRYWLGARALAVNERPGELQLLPEFPAAWRGGALEVIDATIGTGKASFAIRWHGYRPALLWDIQSETPLTLSCPALDPSWSTTDAKGEALLAGTSEGLASVPAPGDSFS